MRTTTLPKILPEIDREGGDRPGPAKVPAASHT
jgi:hypothetical protein